jgi:hypothetical protein
VKKLLTANRLSDGAVVWLTAQLGWSHRFEEAFGLEPDAAEAQLALAQAQPWRFVGPYLVGVDAAGVDRRERLRESIRARGPSAGHSLDAG